MISTSDVNPRNDLATTSLALASTPIFSTLVFFIVAYNPYTGVFWKALAIAAGVTALSSFAAIITGAASLRQIKKQGGRGKDLAMIGITVGVLTMVTILVPALLIMLAFMGVFGRISL